MGFELTVVANEHRDEFEICRQLEHMLSDLPETRVIPASRLKSVKDWGQIIFIDSEFRGLDQLLRELDRSQRAVFLLAFENSSLSLNLVSALNDGRVDDVLVRPFRMLEVLSKLRHYQQILLWDEVKTLNASFSEMLARLHEDLRLAERIQKSKVPLRFPGVKGFTVSSRYFAGMRSGGDYFDLAESKNSSQMSIILSDSSSYGLSSAMLSVLMRVAMKLSADELRSCGETLEKIRTELTLTLGEKDRLSIFYGIVSRKDYKLRYLNLGSSRAFYASPQDPFVMLPSHSEAITQGSEKIISSESEVLLLPESRFVLLSDGFIEAAGGEGATLRLLESFRGKDPKDLLNELAFQVKSKFNDPDDMPEQDCTALVFDADSRLIRKV